MIEQITPLPAVDRFAVGKLDAAARAPGVGMMRIDVRARSHRAALIDDQPLERGEQRLARAARDRAARRLDRESDHFHHLPPNRRSPGPRPVCSTHGAHSARTASDR